MSRVVHFEIHVEDPERAKKFYGTLFDWKFTAFGGGEEYYLITTGPDDQPGINGGMIRRRGSLDGTAVIAYVCTIGVDNLDATLEKARANGAQEALPKMPIPGVGWLAYLKDPEGNIFGVMQPDPQAK